MRWDVQLGLDDLSDNDCRHHERISGQGLPKRIWIRQRYAKFQQRHAGAALTGDRMPFGTGKYQQYVVIVPKPQNKVLRELPD